MKNRHKIFVSQLIVYGFIFMVVGMFVSSDPMVSNGLLMVVIGASTYEILKAIEGKKDD